MRDRRVCILGLYWRTEVVCGDGLEPQGRGTPKIRIDLSPLRLCYTDNNFRKRAWLASTTYLLRVSR
jgi:hypothetical protein